MSIRLPGNCAIERTLPCHRTSSTCQSRVSYWAQVSFEGGAPGKLTAKTVAALKVKSKILPLDLFPAGSFIKMEDVPAPPEASPRARPRRLRED